MSLLRKTQPFPPCQQRQRRAERQLAESYDKGHGRRETRRLESTTALNSFLKQLGWSSVAQVFRITRTRTFRNRETGHLETTREVAYGITSLSRAQADARQLLTFQRGHWGIENRLHWVRDQTFAEDASRIHTGCGPQVLATARNAVIALCRRYKSLNIAESRRDFAWNPQRLFRILGFMKN